MDISFANTKLKKMFNSQRELTRHCGARQAKSIRVRMTILENAASLADLGPPMSPPSRCHQLTGGQRAGQLSVDVGRLNRLLFVPDHDPLPMRPEGGLDWAGVTAITILGVEDTHG